MVTLSSAHGYVILFALAALFGAIGGIAYELAQTRSKETGMIELPGLRGKRYLELGFISSMLLGAIAAIAISYFFTPETQVKAVVNGVSTIQTKWQIVKVIPLSLIVGSAGGAFLDAMRGRILGQLNAQKAAATQAAGKAAVDQVAQVAKAATSGQLAAAGTNAIAAATSAIAAAQAEVPPQLQQGISKLVQDPDLNAAIDKVFLDYKSAQPLTVHTGKVSDTVTTALAGASENTLAVIDESAAAAKAGIDAAASA